MLKYIKVWLLLTIASFQTFLISRIGALLFISGKVLRFIFFLAFLLLLLSKTTVLAGYDLYQVLLFYLTFNLVDVITQMLFREVYRFREQIISGNFDLILVKPVNSLFRSLFGWTDLLDLITLFPLFITIAYIISKLANITLLGIILYVLMIINALFIAASFHTMVLALAILTTEIDHAIMIYRDFTGMGKVPIDVYSEPVRSLVTFVIPVGIMMSFPAKVLFGILSPLGIISAFIISTILFSCSLILWRYALQNYTSASS